MNVVVQLLVSAYKANDSEILKLLSIKKFHLQANKQRQKTQTNKTKQKHKAFPRMELFWCLLFSLLSANNYNVFCV